MKCETCWRVSDLVDWGRDGQHQFVYSVHSPAVPKLLEEMNGAGAVEVASPPAVFRASPQAQTRLR